MSRHLFGVATVNNFSKKKDSEISMTKQNESSSSRVEKFQNFVRNKKIGQNDNKITLNSSKPSMCRGFQICGSIDAEGV